MFSVHTEAETDVTSSGDSLSLPDTALNFIDSVYPV